MRTGLLCLYSVVVPSLLLAACSAPDGPVQDDGDAGPTTPDGNGVRLDAGHDPIELVSIAIDPAQVELVSTDGSRPEHRADGGLVRRAHQDRPAEPLELGQAPQDG